MPYYSSFALGVLLLICTTKASATSMVAAHANNVHKFIYI